MKIALLVIGVLVGLAVGTRSAGAEKLRLTNAASVMEPTLPKGKTITIDLGAYKTSVPQRGDIVAFIPLLDIPEVEKQTWCFRVLALPGEVVSEKDGKLLVNGRVVAVLGQPKSTIYVTGKEHPGVSLKLKKLPFAVPDAAYFLVGDNPEASNDSRFFGAVPLKNIKGRVILD